MSFGGGWFGQAYFGGVVPDGAQIVEPPEPGTHETTLTIHRFDGVSGQGTFPSIAFIAATQKRATVTATTKRATVRAHQSFASVAQTRKTATAVQRDSEGTMAWLTSP